MSKIRKKDRKGKGFKTRLVLTEITKTMFPKFSWKHRRAVLNEITRISFNFKQRIKLIVLSSPYLGTSEGGVAITYKVGLYFSDAIPPVYLWILPQACSVFDIVIYNKICNLFDNEH